MGLLHSLSWLLRTVFGAILLILLLVAGAISWLGFTASGNQFLADRIAEQMSTQDMQISLEGATGLLEGRFHLDRVTVADTKGRFAEIRDLDIFWKPWELTGWRFHAQRIAIATVAVDRIPVRTLESEPSQSSFSLPVEVKIDSFDMPVIALGKAIAKRDTVLAVSGSAQAISDRIALDLNAVEKDRLNATARASVTYAVNTGTLALDGAISEPQGGLMARLLTLPGTPPVEVVVKGAGPLADWKGSISGRVDGADVLLISGSHKMTEPGVHDIALQGGGRISEFMPQPLRSLFAGETRIDVDARFSESGLLDIKKGSVANDSFTLSANGQIDPEGEARLTADLKPAHDVIHVDLPLASGPVTADIAKAQLTLSGLFRSATVDITASLAGIATPQADAGSIVLSAHSSALNLADRTGRMSYDLNAALLTLNNPNAAKVIEGPLRIRGDIDLASDAITLNASEFESARLGGKISGKFVPATHTAEASFNLFLLPQGLFPPDIEAKVKGTLGLSGQLTAVVPAKVSLRNLKLSSNLLTAVGSAALDGDMLTANVSADVIDLSDFADKVAGKAHIAVDAAGPVGKLAVAARVTSGEIRLAGHAVQTVDLKLAGTADPKKPLGKLTMAAIYLGQAINAEANALFENGLVSVPSLTAAIGPNRVTGSMTLDAAFLPSGKLNFDLPDIETLAALAGQTVDGALKGTADITAVGGRITGTITASGPRLRAAGVKIENPKADIRIDDLVAKNLSGKIAADQIASGAQHIDRIALDIGVSGRQINFNLDSQFESAPLIARGTVLQQDEELTVKLSSFSAMPGNIAVRLATPTDISVVNGVVKLNDMAIAAGDGSILVNGAAGEMLDLTAKITGLPVSLANAVSPGLDAAGMVSGTVAIKGEPAAPVIQFDTTIQGLATSQTRNARLPNLDIVAKGQFVDHILSLEATSTLRQQTLNAMAEVKLADGTVMVPAFTLDIGKSTVTGALALDRQFQPSGKIAFDITDANALAQIVGRKAEGAIKGTADITSSAGLIDARIDANGLIRKQAIKALADVRLENGAVSLPSLTLNVGRNTLSGAVNLDSQFMPSGKLDFDLPDVALLAAMAGEKAEGAVKGSADVKTAAGKIDAKVAATGTIRGQAIDILLEAVQENGAISMPALKLDVGRNTLNGALTLGSDFMPSGKIGFDFPDIALLAAFAGQKAEGAIKGSADIQSENGKISGMISANGTRLIASGAEIVKPAVDLKIADLAAGQMSGTITADRVASGANVLAKLALDFNRAGSKTGFVLKSQYDAAPLTAKGAIEQQADGLILSLDSFSAAPKKIPVKLDRPTQIRIKDGSLVISSLAIGAGKGSIVVSGSTGKTLNLTAKISALPASLANTFVPGLDAAGTVSVNVTVKGEPSNPVIVFDASWQNAAVSQTRAAGLSNFSVTAKGQLANNVLSINANAKAGDGLSLNAGGTVGIAGNRPLNIKVNGQLPFVALAGPLAAQGVDLKGDARFDLTVGGAAANPSISGKITTSGATLTVIRQNLTIKNLAATVDLDGKQARITSLNGNLDGGGTLEVNGTIGIAPNSGFPADLKIVLANAVYTDGKVVAAKLSGDLGITGSLTRTPVLNGTIKLRRVDITIPQKLPGTLAQLDVKHDNAAPKVIAQTKEIKENRPGSSASTKDTGGISLNLRISAPRQIFVRGRGLDAELGGNVTVTGTSNAPNVSGGFKMRRGRLTIVGRRLDFTEGDISFGGAMMPTLNMIATSTVDATTVSVTVSGPASNPAVAFTSSPALPQDEVLALLIFGRNSAELSPVQIAQLADAVATLAGGQSNSLFNKLRQGLGVDDLDVGTDENGKSNVSVGKYLNKRTYLQLQQGVDKDSTSKAVINLDIGKGVKLRGEAGSDGSTAGGVFFEKEY